MTENPIIKKYFSKVNKPYTLSDSFYQNESDKLIQQFYKGEKSFRIFTASWLLFKLYRYIIALPRPKELFEPLVYYSKLLLPQFPNVWLFGAIWLLAFALNIFSYFRANIIVRILLVLALLWINLIEWSFGYNSHVGHLFLLIHLLMIFFPAKPSTNENNLNLNKTIRLFYLGIMATYSFAGIWKIIGLAKNLLQGSSISWMNPNALLYTVIVQNLDGDLHYGSWYRLFAVPYLWQILFLCIVFNQTFSVVTAFRNQLLSFWVSILITTHIFNYLAMQTAFFTSIFTLAALFWPYFFTKKESLPCPYQINFITNQTNNYTLKRIYDNGDIDQYYGFYAVRENLFEKKKWYSGLLYFPGVTYLIDRLFFKKV